MILWTECITLFSTVFCLPVCSCCPRPCMPRRKTGTVPICAKHPPGRSGKWGTVPVFRPLAISGRYPHLATFNHQGECGTGAVVPWAERLWVITYAPHKPEGSDDKLYEIDAALHRIARPESVGGTPANRMIHRESNQLNIGPYFIDSRRNVRAIPPVDSVRRTDGHGPASDRSGQQGLYLRHGRAGLRGGRP